MTDDGFTRSGEGEWDTTSAEAGSQWKPTQAGDALTGIYSGFRTVTMQDTGESFTVFQIKTDSGDVMTVKSSYKIDEAFASVKVGDVVRLTFVGEVPMGPGKTPMKDYRMQRKRTGAAPAPEPVTPAVNDAAEIPF